MQDNQTTIELQTEHPEAGTESTSLPDVDAENENPVGEIIMSNTTNDTYFYIISRRRGGVAS